MIPMNAAAAAPTLRIVLLAAGFSVRLRHPKALARIHGRSLLERTVRILAPLAAHDIIVVVPPRARRIRAMLRGYRVSFAENPLRGRGMSTSVRCGLRHSRYSGATLLLPVDLAALTARDLARLILRWKGSRRRVAARKAGDLGVTPLILPRRLYPQALGISGDNGLKDLLNQLPHEDLVRIVLPSAGFDVDTPRDLDRARRRAGGGRN